MQIISAKHLPRRALIHRGLIVILIIPGHLRVKIPTFKVDSPPSILNFLNPGLNFRQRFPSVKMKKSHHNIGHLHTGVINVVLHVDLLPGGAEQADEGVAQNGVAQMAYVGGFVGIDGSVLHKTMNHGCPRSLAFGDLEFLNSCH